MNEVHEAIREMVAWERGVRHRIQHFLKVHSFCRYIGMEEGLDEATLRRLELAAVVHDIGIRPAEEKFGKHDGPLQEREGVEPARRLLRGTGHASRLRIRGRPQPWETLSQRHRGGSAKCARPSLHARLH